jgi:hypothetical protein
MQFSAAKTLRASAIAIAVVLAAALVPAPPASAEPDYDPERVHLLPLDEVPKRIVVSPDGRRLYGSSNTIDEPGTLTVIDLVAGELVTRKVFAEGVGDVEVSPDGRRVYFTHGGPTWLDECFVTEVDASTLRVIRDLKVGERCREILLSRTGKTIFVSDNTHVLFVSVSTGAVRATISLPYGTDDLALSADGAKLYALEGSRGIIHTIGVASKALLGSASLPDLGSDPDWIDRLHVSPDGEMIYAVSNRAIYAGRVARLHDMVRIPIRNFGVSALSRDGKRLYLSGAELRIFHTDTSTFTTAPTEWGRSGLSLAESIDGRRLHISALNYIITLGATRSLAYPDSSLTATAGKRFVSTRPTFRYGGYAPTYAVYPALPKGLRLNSSTGVISGTPSRAQSTQSYRVYTDIFNADTNVNERTRASITIRVARQTTAAKLTLSKTSQKYKTTRPAKLTAVVSPRIPGTFRISTGSHRLASVSTKTGKISWTLPRNLSARKHTLKVVFVPANRDIYRTAASSPRTFTVVR